MHYDNTGSPRVVEVAFKDFADGNGNYTPNSALYKYAENSDHSGSFEFVTKADVDHDPLRVQETVAIKSEWLGTGQGKSNAGATGGSLAERRDARGVLEHATSSAPTSPTRGIRRRPRAIPRPASRSVRSVGTAVL